MSGKQSNNNKKGSNQSAAQARKALKAEILNDIRAAAGQPAKGKGRGKRTRRAKAANKAQTHKIGDNDLPAYMRFRESLTGKGSTRNAFGNKQSMPIEETEYVGEIIPSAYPAFSVQQFPVNAGQAATFPWLASIAKNFEKYEFEFLEFIYKREVSEYAANGQTGKVIMSFDTDATDVPPTTKQQMEDTDPHCDCMPSENMVLRIPEQMLQRFKDAFFVRPGAQPANTDLKTFDLGNLYVACQGTAANTAVGELHVRYRLRLRIPVLLANANLSGSAVMNAAAGTVASPLLNGVAASNGALTITQALTVITVTGLTIGAEYAVYLTDSGNATLTWSAFVGWTLKTYLANGNGQQLTPFTATATATTASVSLLAGGPTDLTFLSVSQIPVTAT